MTTVQPRGTETVSSPSRKPLKLRAPFRPVRPATSSKVAVLVAVSDRNQAGSMAWDGTTLSSWAHTGAGSAGPSARIASPATESGLSILTSGSHPLASPDPHPLTPSPFGRGGTHCLPPLRNGEGDR